MELVITKKSVEKTVQSGFLLINFKIIPLRNFFKGQETTLTKKIKVKSRNRVFIFLRGTPGAVVTLRIRSYGSNDVPTASLTAQPSSLALGEDSTLTWSTSYAHTISIDPEIGTVAKSGSLKVSPLATTNYILTAIGTGGTATTEATVNVTSPPPHVTISAEPESVIAGGSTTLSWLAENATQCTIDPDIGDVAVSGSNSVVPTKTTTYTITAVGPGGTATANVLVTQSPLKVSEILKQDAHYLTPENTNAAAKSALLQHDLDWFYQTLTNEAAEQDKKMFLDAGIDPQEKFKYVNRDDIEYVTGKVTYKDGFLLLTEVNVDNIDGTKITLCTGFVEENGLWKVTYKYTEDEELLQYYDVSYSNCIASYRFPPEDFLEDSCWHGNDLTNYNTTGIALDQRNTEELTTATFNGVDNGLGRSVINDMPKEKISMGGWIKAENTDHNARIIEIGNDRNDSSAIVLDPGNGFRYWLHINGARIERTAAMDYDYHDNNWHHVYMTYDGTVMKLYVDGQIKDSNPISGLIDSAAVLNIGQHDAINNGTSNTFKGRIDDIQIYNKPLNAEEIMAKFTNGTTQSL